MRVANKTIYDTIKFELGNVTEDLYEANKVVATGKRINSLSDDPVGLTQCLNIRSSLSNLEQLERNISTGRNWLDAGETALDSINASLSDAKVLSLQMANDSMNASDRAAAAEQIQGTLLQVLDLSNTMVNRQYIFAGTRTDTKPFEFDNEEDPTVATYSGNDGLFTVKIGKDTKVAVGRDGEEVFCDSNVMIAESNSKIDFIEYLGGAATNELTATVLSGIYSHDGLASAIESAMENASSQSGNSINYVVTYDSATKKFTIQDDGTTSGAHLELLWRTGTNANTSIAPDIGFDAVDVRDALVSDTPVPVAGFPVTIDGTNDKIDFIEDTGSGPTSLTANITQQAYANGAALAAEVEIQMEAVTANAIDYEVTYDAVNEKFVIEEDGTDLQELQILWNTNPSGNSAGPALGFTQDDNHTPPTSDNTVQWGIFKTLINLKHYLEMNDVDGIQRSITRLGFHFDNLTSTISNTGFKKILLDVKEKVISDLDLSYLTRKSKLEDADVIEAIMELQAKEAAYQAALASSAKVMQLSLMDYL
jgi:flagellar hook-associated protein 3 FlgL